MSVSVKMSTIMKMCSSVFGVGVRMNTSMSAAMSMRTSMCKKMNICI